MGQKNALAQETEQIENLLSEIDQYLNGKTRSELIAKSKGKKNPLFFRCKMIRIFLIWRHEMRFCDFTPGRRFKRWKAAKTSRFQIALITGLLMFILTHIFCRLTTGHFLCTFRATSDGNWAESEADDRIRHDSGSVGLPVRDCSAIRFGNFHSQ